MRITCMYALYSFVLLVCAVARADIIRCGSNNCGGAGCNFGPNELNLAINATSDGDTLLLYGNIFVNNVKPTPVGFDDTIYTILDSITIRGVPADDVFATPAALVINSPGTKGLNLFALATEGIRLQNFTIDRNFVNGNKDSSQDVSTIRFRSCFNGTCFFPVQDIEVSNVVMQLDQTPFPGSDIYFENGTFSNIRIQDCSFSAETGVFIANTSWVSNIAINRNRFLWSAYENNNLASKPEVDISYNFWRPCPYRGPGKILPSLGVQSDDLWLPYCVSFNCTLPGPIATQVSSGGYEGWTSIQDALTSGESDVLTVAVTAPFFVIDSSQIIWRRILLTSIVEGCDTACFANGTWPTVVISNAGGSSATIGFVVLGQLMSASNLQFQLDPLTRLVLYRQVQPYNAAQFAVNRGPLAFESIAFTANSLMQDSLNVSLTTNYSFDVRSGGDIIISNIQAVGGQQAMLFWGPNTATNELEQELLLENCLLDAQLDFTVYMAGPTFRARLESNYMGGNGTEYGLLVEKMSSMDILRTQLILLGTGVALSEVSNIIFDCNACVDVSTVCISATMNSENNVARFNTFAVPNSARFLRVPDNDDTLDVMNNVNLGKVSPLARVFQQFSSPNFPFSFDGPPMFSSTQDVLLRHSANSTQNEQQCAADALIMKSTYLQYDNMECFNYRDTLSNVYSAYGNVRDSCIKHSLKWDPFDNTTLNCDQLSPIVQKIPEFSWQRLGSSSASGPDCVLTSMNTTEDVRFAVGTRSMREAVVCAACDGDVQPFHNKTCDFVVDSFQEAMEQVRISQLEDATILVNGICFVFDEEIDVEGLTIENCGTAILSPTQGLQPVSMMMMKRDVMDMEADFQLRITVNDTTIQGIIFNTIGDNTTYADDYCVIFIDGSLLPIFNTTLFNNSFLQPRVDHVCTLMDTNTDVLQNRFKEPRVGVRMSADSNEIVPQVSGVNRYMENLFQDGRIHMLYVFQESLRQPEPPYSRLHVIKNDFMFPADVSLDVLGISGRRTRLDLLFQKNEYTNPTPDSAACDPNNSDSTICCEDLKECGSRAQRFVDSEDALFDNERYNGGALMQMAGRSVLVQNPRFRDRSGAIVGADDISLLQNPFTPHNITIDGADFAEEATLLCNLGKSFNPVTRAENRLTMMNTVINGPNIGANKDDCDNTLIGVFTGNCFDRQGRQIFSARNTAPFEASQFIGAESRLRENCTAPLVYIPSQQGGTGTCNCEFLPPDQFIQVLVFQGQEGSRVMRNVVQNEQINSEVRNCPTGQIHDPNNVTQCIVPPTSTSTPAPTPTPTATPTPTPKTSPRSPSSPSSSDGKVHHLWWLWVILCVIFALVIIGLIAWAATYWRRSKKSKAKEETDLQSQETQLQRMPLTQRRVPAGTNNFGGDSVRF